jgi:transmembrane sensor
MSSSQDLMQRIANAGARMDPGLSNWDVERLVAGARQRRQFGRARRQVLTTAAAFAGVLAVLLLFHGRHVSSRPGLTVERLVAQVQAPVADRANAILRLKDGSTAIALDPATEIRVSQDVTDRAELVLSRGRGRFDVKPRPTRTFVVHAGNVTITVLGTLFTLERVADRVGVSVESGTVHVDWGLGSALLEQNNSGWYPPLVISGQDDHKASQEEAPPSRTARSSKRSVLGAGQPDPTSPSEATNAESAADLLLASDKARIAGHGEEAAELLRKLLREHRSDARAPLAAFTLGRMLLMELGRPLEAAGTFADARRLSPGGPFAEDALAREVEAYSKAGVPARAHTRAEEYLHLYPEGRRAAIVRVMGGMK